MSKYKEYGVSFGTKLSQHSSIISYATTVKATSSTEAVEKATASYKSKGGTLQPLLQCYERKPR